jgi:hypothetical protein
MGTWRRLGRIRKALVAAWPEPAAQPDSPPDKVTDPASLGGESIAYITQMAEAAYSEQDELNESVWRSLPFFAASLGLAVTIMPRAAAAVPLPSSAIYSIATNSMLAASFTAFAWAIRWLWIVVAPRDYEYPSDQAEVQAYAKETAQYLASTGLAGEELDKALVSELRMFRAKQVADAARTNFSNNVRRLKARSQVLLFMMVGFVLAMATGATTYLHELAYPTPAVVEGKTK